ncbi:hypothetical protein ACWEOO_40785, partial [Kribbella sp. NPDC004138]
RGVRAGRWAGPPAPPPPATGVDLVAASAASRDHAIGSTEPWTTSFTMLPPTLGGFVPYHPNAAGMQAVAELILATLRD